MNGGDGELRFGPFRLSRLKRELATADGPVALGSRAFDLLVTLIDHDGELVSKHELMRLVWPSVVVDDNNLQVQVLALRRALGPQHMLVQTVPGRGYRFSGRIEAAPEPPAAPPSLPAAPADAAAPAALPPTNLPEETAPLIGRERELAELAALLGERRLVTLAGPSGVGKTRLALALGRHVLDRFPDGVWLIELAPLADPALVASTAASVLGVRPGDAAAPAESLAEAIRKQRLLLILDNCEHLVAAAAEFARILAGRVPGVAILATSQENLRVPAEHLYRLDPLALPPPGAEDMTPFSAVALFASRASASDRRFALDPANAPIVADICRALDGLPLALEMAAARVPLLGLEGLRARLGQRLHMLTGGPRTAEARHRTLRDTVAWSHDLLDSAERTAFRRLGIFAGSFTLDAVSAVAADQDERAWTVIDALGRLIDKSLVTVEGEDPPRYRLLETLRLFAQEQLDASGEHDALAESHARFFTGLFDRAYEAWETTPDADWLKRYSPELDNVRAALNWALAEEGRAEIAVSLAGSAALLFDQLSLAAEGRGYVDRASALTDEAVRLESVARLLRQIGVLWLSADRSHAMAALEQAASLYAQLSDTPSLGTVRATIGDIETALGRHAEAETTLLDAKELLWNSKRSKPLFNVMNNLGILAGSMGRMEEARSYFESALTFAGNQRSVFRETLILMNLAEVEFNLENVPRAIDLISDAILRLRLNDKPGDLGWALCNLGTYLLAENKTREAEIAAAEALKLLREEGGFIVRACLQQWALLAALSGKPVEAARLIGFVDAGVDAAGEVRQPTEQQVRDRLAGLLATALRPERLTAYTTEGATWAETEAIDYALRYVVARGNPLNSL